MKERKMLIVSLKLQDQKSRLQTICGNTRAADLAGRTEKLLVEYLGEYEVADDIEVCLLSMTVRLHQC